eukprot:PhF_6_TR5246/c0_g1_i1/m.7609
MSRHLVLVCLMVTILITCSVASTELSPTSPSPSYRCQRPFESMPSFKPKDHKLDNCNFGPLVITSAAAQIRTESNNNSTSTSSKVYVVLTATTKENKLSELKHIRYALELIAPDKVIGIKYDGYDGGQGYFVCDALANQTNSICNTTPSGNPLHDWTWDGEVGRSVFRADILGTWEFRITFTRPRGGGGAEGGALGRAPIGKLIVPFNVTQGMAIADMLPAKLE